MGNVVFFFGYLKSYNHSYRNKNWFLFCSTPWFVSWKNCWSVFLPLTPKDRLVNILAHCVYNLQRFLEIQDFAGLVLDESEARESAMSLRMHLRTYAILADHYYKNRIMMYKIRCKTHYLFHVSEEVEFWKLNQNMFHTFQEESFLGKIKAIGVRCHGRSCTARLFQRYFLCLAVYFQEHRKRDR